MLWSYCSDSCILHWCGLTTYILLKYPRLVLYRYRVLSLTTSYPLGREHVSTAGPSAQRSWYLQVVFHLVLYFHFGTALYQDLFAQAINYVLPCSPADIFQLSPVCRSPIRYRARLVGASRSTEPSESGCYLALRRSSTGAVAPTRRLPSANETTT